MLRGRRVGLPATAVARLVVTQAAVAGKVCLTARRNLPTFTTSKNCAPTGISPWSVYLPVASVVVLAKTGPRSCASQRSQLVLPAGMPVPMAGMDVRSFVRRM